MQTSKVKIVDIRGKEQLRPLLAENPEAIEEGMVILAERLPTTKDPLDILAKDKRGSFVIIQVVDLADDSQVDRALRAYDFVRSNRAMLERLFPGASSKIQPRLILIAHNISHNLAKLEKCAALNVDCLLDLKEYSVIQLPNGETAVVTHPVTLSSAKQDAAQLEHKIEHLESLLEENAEKLKETRRLAIIGENASMVIHDLKNPLQVLINSSYNARLLYESSNAETKKILMNFGLNCLLETIDKQVEYMNGIVSNLQDQSTVLKPKVAPESLVELVNGISNLIPPNIELETNLATDMAEFDQLMMKRALINLVTNAIQAMPEGGRLVIETFEEDRSAVIKVKDSGVGIPKDLIPNIFSAFSTTKCGGTGMGLVVVKRMVEAHGGTASVESEVGKGSTFTIRIPLSQRERAAWSF